MKSIILALVTLVALPVYALDTSPLEPAVPFEPVVLAEPDVELSRTYLGTLDGYPDMVEFSVFASTSLALQLWQAPTDTPTQFGLIVVRVNEDGRGVTEVARAQQERVVWETTPIEALGSSLTVSESLETTLAPGQYRIEVSTPTNQGAYVLQLLNGEGHGYFTTVASVFAVQQHFSLGVFALLRSPYVLYPIGLVVVGLGLFFTWRYHRRITHAG